MMRLHFFIDFTQGHERIWPFDRSAVGFVPIIHGVSSEFRDDVLDHEFRVEIRAIVDEVVDSVAGAAGYLQDSFVSVCINDILNGEEFFLA